MDYVLENQLIGTGIADSDRPIKAQVEGVHWYIRTLRGSGSIYLMVSCGGNDENDENGEISPCTACKHIPKGYTNVGYSLLRREIQTFHAFSEAPKYVQDRLLKVYPKISLLRISTEGTEYEVSAESGESKIFTKKTTNVIKTTNNTLSFIDWVELIKRGALDTCITLNAGFDEINLNDRELGKQVEVTNKSLKELIKLISLKTEKRG